jgi:hypothetical protein
VRGNGSARAETSVKATARPNTIRITMRRGPLRDTLDDDLSIDHHLPICHLHRLGLGAILFVWLGMRSGTGHSVRGLTRTHYFDYGIIIAVPMTMREINDLTDLQI